MLEKSFLRFEADKIYKLLINNLARVLLYLHVVGFALILKIF